MRLKRITIEGFRAFGDVVEIDLNADVILLQGPNGVGKTSLLDAILWCLTGAIQRFGDHGSPVSLYSREGFARVALTMWDGSGEVEVVRGLGAGKHSIRVKCAGDDLEGAIAEQRLCDLLLPHLKDRAEAQRALGSVLTRGVYLQQDLVRQFVEEDSSTDRFALLSEVVGAGVVLEVQQWLERSRGMWSRSTSARRREELDPLEKRLAQIDDQLSRLSENDDAQVERANAREVSEGIHRRAVALLGTNRLPMPEPPSTPSQLDRFLKELGAERARVEREAIAASSLMEQFAELAPPDGSETERIDGLRMRETELVAELQKLEDAFADETKRLIDERERAAIAAGRADRRAALARLALDELGPLCPVCEQTHDVEHTRGHLESLIAAVQEVARGDSSPAGLEKIVLARGQAAQQLEEVRRQLRADDERLRDAEARRSLVTVRLTDAGVDMAGNVVGQLAGRRDGAMALLTSLDAIVREGEGFSLSVLRLGEQRRREELATERSAVAAQIDELKSKLGSQERTHALAGTIIEGLRGASLAVTQRQVEQIEPLFQRIYSRIDPHPTFRVTQIAASMKNGKGHLSLGISDPESGAGPKEAGPLLSSSQLNSYAVSLFLAMNLALPTLKLDVTILDDPLQSLDSLNLLGLVDVLRRFRAHRQIIVSTHEDRLVGLLQRKLRPIREGERMIMILFDEWSREGPVFRTVHTDYTTDEDQVLAA